MKSTRPNSGLRPGFLVAVAVGLGVVGVILLRSGPQPQPAAVAPAEVAEAAPPASGGVVVSGSRIMARLSGADVSLPGPHVTPGPVVEEVPGAQPWWVEQRISPELQVIAREALDRARNDLFRFGVVHGSYAMLGDSGAAVGGAPPSLDPSTGRAVGGQPATRVTNGVQAYRDSDRIRNNLVKELQQVRREAILRARQAESKAAGGQ